MVRSRVKLSLIAEKTSRKTTFKKRKGGIMKKLNELSTLCGIKACAVVYNGRHDPTPEAWPSKEGAEEVFSRFLEFPEAERAKKMYDQESYTWERILKEEATLKRLQDENREFELRKLMFDLLKDKKTMESYYHDASVFKDLRLFIENYVNEINNRIKMLQVNGESLPFPPLDVAAVEDVNPIAVSNVDAVTMPIGYFDNIQYENMNMNQQALASFNDNHIQYPNMNELQELVQYQAPTNVSDHVQYQNMNQEEQVQYQVLDNVYDQNGHDFYGLNQDMGLDLIESSNQYPNPHQWMAQPQQMNYAEELASVASMGDNYYNYHQLPTTSPMPFMDVSAPSINNNLWPTRIGLE